MFKFFLEKHQANIWKAWYNVIQDIKLKKAKTVEFHQRQKRILRVQSIHRWHSQFSRTRRCRAKTSNLERQFRFKYYMATFYAWKTHYTQRKRFVQRLSNMALMISGRLTDDSFKAVKSFSVSKGLVLANRRNKGTEDIISLLQQSYLKRLGAEFQKYKNQCGMYSEKTKRLKMLFGKFMSLRMRNIFEWWCTNHRMASLSEEMHKTGPVRAEHWLAMRKIENLKAFMRKEHYSEQEIDKFYKDVCERNDSIMKKYLTRALMFQNDKMKHMPEIMHRWKMYTALRKMLRHHFRFCNNA